MTLTRHEKHLIIKAVSCPLSSISILSTIFVFYLYLRNRQLQFFPFRIIVYLQFSDFILSVSQLFIIFEEYHIQDSNFLCQLQGFLMQYGILATITWSTIISSLMLASLWYRDKVLEKYENILVLIGFWFPGFVAIMF